MPLQINKLSSGDLPVIAEIHLAAFPDSALALLGVESVRRNYEWLLNGPHDVCALGVYENDELIGFCFGGVFHGALGGFLKKNRWFLAWRVITHPWLIGNPIFRSRMILANRNIKKSLLLSPLVNPDESQLFQQIHSKSPAFIILSIATQPKHQLKGVGKLLLQKSEEIAFQRGFARMSLNVHINNNQAIVFYKHMGWQEQYTDGIWKGNMEKLLIK